MRLTLTKKWILSYLAFCLCSFLAVAIVTSDMLLEQLIREKASAFYEEGICMADQYVGNYFEHPDSRQTLTTVQSQLEAISVYLDARIWLINTDGDIVLDSDPPSGSRTAERIEHFNSVLPTGTYYMTGEFFGMFEQETLSVLVPVSHRYHVRGYIAIHLPMSALTREKEGFLWSFYAALILLFTLTFLYALTGWFLSCHPIRKLQKAAAHYAAGHFQEPIALGRSDEIGYIADTMDFMARALRDCDEDQRKMISNVSHDFRSPLTSIKGYIEAILDGTIPPELQEKYLRIVLRETERLTGLTSSLLALNSMEPGKNRLNRTDFDINAVIKNTAAAFEGTCTARHIAIDLLFCDWHSGVNADVGKIQQVLYNLIDNAIKFSRPDSTITVETSEKYEKLFVSVRDTGIGIPKDSLNKIWERFYKTDLSRGKDKKGTGLGLSIVREIIQLHGEHINVVSTVGVGTEFTFSLPKTTE